MMSRLLRLVYNKGGTLDDLLFVCSCLVCKDAAPEKTQKWVGRLSEIESRNSFLSCLDNRMEHLR
jgi:hypothetical protein